MYIKDIIYIFKNNYLFMIFIFFDYSKFGFIFLKESILLKDSTWIS